MIEEEKGIELIELVIGERALRSQIADVVGDREMLRANGAGRHVFFVTLLAARLATFFAADLRPRRNAVGEILQGHAP